MFLPSLPRSLLAMSFQDVYHNEVLVSRRTRSQRASFWAKILGVVLMIVIGATLRSEPQLRQALVTAGMDGVAAVSGQVQSSRTEPSAAAQTFQLPDVSQMKAMLTQSKHAQAQYAQADIAVQTQVVARPRDAVRVNRHGAPGGLKPRFQSSGSSTAMALPADLDTDAASAAAKDLSRLLQAMKPGQ